MVIEWNKATWYSKLVSILLFTGFIPILTFWVGREYQKTTQSIEETNKVVEALGKNPLVPIQNPGKNCKEKVPKCQESFTPTCQNNNWACTKNLGPQS